MAEAYQKIKTSTLLSTVAYDPPVGLLQTGYAVEDIPACIIVAKGGVTDGY